MLVKDQELVRVKGKRSKRPRPDSPPLAASSTADHSHSSCNVSVECRRDDEDMANCLILLARGEKSMLSSSRVGLYQCKTCSKSFPSFQALGGHRTSHTKPVKEEKKVVASTERPNGDQVLFTGESTFLSLQINPAKSRIHECSICGAEFASGQALGGHMRRHRSIASVDWEKRSRSSNNNNNNAPSLDLNLPAPEDQDHRESKFPFLAKQVIVFSASPMVDCHH